MRKREFNSLWLYGHEGGEKIPVTLPHDAMLHDGRSKDAPSASGGAYFLGGVYEYEKAFSPSSAPTQFLQFCGVMRSSRVYLNGEEAGGAAYGYIPFWVDLGGRIKPGMNTVKVVADNSLQPSSRWYTGGGIYRSVWLWEGGDAVILPQGLKVRTLGLDIPVIEALAETKGAPEGSEIEFKVLDKSGKTLASGRAPLKDGKASLRLKIPGAKPWCQESPVLYKAEASLLSKGEVLDEAETAFGLRTIEKRADGIYINGKRTLLRGGSVHHDNGVIGAVSLQESEARRVRIMKEHGFNAIRCAHNPASEELLEACDKYGMYVIDETWDMWYSPKCRHDYSSSFLENYESDIREIVEKDFNHPSVIMYSIGNEVSEPASAEGLKLSKELISLFHSLDSSRLVTAGINIMILTQSAKGTPIYKEESGGESLSGAKSIGMTSTMYNFVASFVGPALNKAGNSAKADRISSPVLDSLDVAGYNYGSGRYPKEGKEHPGRLVFGSEIFPQEAAKNWKLIKEYPWLCGDFLWSGWDYLGECGVGAWSYDKDGRGFDKPYPWKLAAVGVIDILGNPDGEMFWAEAGWGTLNGVRLAVRPLSHPGVKPAKAVWRGTDALPSWSWRGAEGCKTTVEAFTEGSEVELFLNGRSIGRKRTKDSRALFKLRYEPGEIKATAYDEEGKARGEDVLLSGNGKLRLSLSIEREALSDRELETVYVPIEITDSEGIIESNADTELRVTVQGGELLGFGSANPRTEEEFCAGVYTTYYGRSLAVVRKTRGESAVLSVQGADGLSGSIEIS